MAQNNRVFIAFAIEDVRSRDLFVGQARNERTPFEFVDMSVKNPWDEEWKRQCRSRIRGCGGLIALVSQNTRNATGQIWEIETAKEERIPVMGVYISTVGRPAVLPNALGSVRVVDWTWPNIKAFLDRL